VIQSQFAGRVRIRVCALILKNEKLLLLRHNSPTRKEPIWMPPGGAVETGETFEDALIREVNEETNLEITPGRLVAIHEFIEHPFHAVELYFMADFKSGELKVGFDPELHKEIQMITDVRYFDINELERDDVYPEFLHQFSEIVADSEKIHRFITKT
jgi:ADP-ribose pyrophosphatase YjhB (NUDIX family)